MATDGNKKYRYVGQLNKGEQAPEFDQDYQDRLIDNKQYKEAYEYALNFACTNIQDEIERRYALDNWYFEKQLESKQEENLSEEVIGYKDFVEAVNSNGGLEDFLMRESQYEQSERSTAYEVARLFQQAKYNLGGGNNRLRIVYENEEQSAFGIDFLAKDNTRNRIDDLYSRMDVDKNLLESGGVEIGRTKGKWYVEFDKNNMWANRILLNASVTDYNGHYPTIYGVNDNGYLTEGFIAQPFLVEQLIQNNDPITRFQLQTTVDVYEATGGDQRSNFAKENSNYYASMIELYKAASKEVDNDVAFLDQNPETSAMINQYIPNVFDGSEALRNAYNRGELKEGDYKLKLKELKDNLFSNLVNLSQAECTKQGRYSMQSDWYRNGDETDENNKYLYDVNDQTIAGELLSIINQVDRENVKVGIEISPMGHARLKITVPKGTKLNDTDDKLERELNITLDTLGVSEINSHMENNYNLRAATWTSRIYNYNIPYESPFYKIDYNVDGLRLDRKGTPNVGNVKDYEAEFVMETDIAARDIAYRLALQHINYDNQIINEKQYLSDLQNAAVSIVMSAYSDFSNHSKYQMDYFYDKIHDRYYPVSEIFRVKDGEHVSANHEKDYAQPTKDAFDEIYKVYEHMLKYNSIYIKDKQNK